MDKIIEWVKALPKPVQLLLILSIFVLMCYGVVRVVFADKFEKKDTEETSGPKSVLMEMQDPTHESSNDSELYKYQNKTTVQSTEDYWNSLSSGNGDSGLTVSGSGGNGGSNNGVTSGNKHMDLDRSEYSEFEIYLITSGAKSKEEIDAEHEKERQKKLERQREEEKANKKMTQEQADSIAFARMEKAYSIAMKYTQPQEQPKEEKSEVEAVSQPRHLNFDGSNAMHIPEDSYSSDDICSSLDGSLDNGLTYSKGNITVRPARATFVKSERIIAGQRVTMRLMEDLQLSNGNIIPANTHISGLCAMGKRLEIKINTLQFGGKIFNTDLSIYDNDGTEGIYCPVIEKKKSQKAGERIGSQAMSDVARIAGSAFGSLGNAAGSLASTAINELSQITLKDGSVAINVVAGYEFYVFENIEALEREYKDNH